jgi:hypothetical protein
METAQEEVITCFGVCVFERLRRLQQRFAEEERAWGTVMSVVVQAMRKSYQLAMHKKSNVGSLDWLSDAQPKQDEAKKLKKVLKKQRRKNKMQAERSEVT